MKKVISLFLAVLLCFSLSGIVFADTETSENMQNAILLAKEKLQLDDEIYVLKDCFENESRGMKTYSITWKSRDEYDRNSISVEIDEEGLIWDYQMSDYARDTKPFPASSWDEGKAAAKAFLEKMNSEILNESEFESITYSKYSTCFIVTYVRMHNGIKVGNHASVSVNSETKQVVSLDSNWNKGASFEEGTPISPGEAKDAFKNGIGYELSYYEKTPSYYSDESKHEICLIYTLKGENKYINALTGKLETYGELVEGGGSGNLNSRKETISDSVSGGSKPSLSEEEIAYTQQVEGLISKEEAESKVRAVPEFQLTEDLKLTSATLTQSERNEYIYHLYFYKDKDEEEGFRYANVTIDAKDGVVIGFHTGPQIYKELTEEEIAENLERNKENALSFMKRYYPALAEETVNTQNNGYNTYFARVYDGVPFSNNGFFFGCRGEALESFYLEWSKLDIPSKSAAKPLEEAYGVILGEDKFTLSYVPTYKDNRCEMKLAYYLENTSNYSAESLIPLNYRMDEKEEIEISYTDIAGHYAETAIRSFAEVELALGDPKAKQFRPEETVKQKEFLTLACEVFNRGTRDIYSDLVTSGILNKNEIAPDKEITRMEAIRFIVKLFGLGETAEKSEIFKDIYTDVSETDRGYAALAAGYGIVNSEVTELYPNNGLRRADAVLMMYNWFTK